MRGSVTAATIRDSRTFGPANSPTYFIVLSFTLTFAIYASEVEKSYTGVGKWLIIKRKGGERIPGPGTSFLDLLSYPMGRRVDGTPRFAFFLRYGFFGNSLEEFPDLVNFRGFLRTIPFYPKHLPMVPPCEKYAPGAVIFIPIMDGLPWFGMFQKIIEKTYTFPCVVLFFLGNFQCPVKILHTLRGKSAVSIRQPLDSDISSNQTFKVVLLVVVIPLAPRRTFQYDTVLVP